MSNREPEANKDDKSSENWLGDLVKPGPKEERHWLHGLVASTGTESAGATPEGSSEAEVSSGRPNIEEQPGSEPTEQPKPGELYNPERESRTLNLEELPPYLKSRLNEVGQVIPLEERELKLPPEKQVVEPTSAAKGEAAKPVSPAKPATSLPPSSLPPPTPPTPPRERRGGSPELRLPIPPVKVARTERPEAPQVVVKVRLDAKSLRQRLLIYRAIAVMMDAGLQLFSCFEFLAEQAETPEVREACLRTAGELASGRSLPVVARSEPVLFSETAARMLEVGMRSGRLVMVLARLADDEEQQWELRQRVWGKLFYPLTLALLALGAAILLPPMALSSLLQQVVSLTDDPPRITLLLLDLSSAVSSPVTLSVFGLVLALAFYLWSNPMVRDRVRGLERYLWQLPWIGDVLQVAYSSRFLQLFALTHEVGLPANQCLRLAAVATGSRVITAKSELMVTSLMEGETLSDSIARGAFLPAIAQESVEAGEQVAKLSDMMRKAADILLTELDYRIDTALKLIEPALLAVLGLFVGVFALGCLLPILKLTESL